MVALVLKSIDIAPTKPEWIQKPAARRDYDRAGCSSAKVAVAVGWATNTSPDLTARPNHSWVQIGNCRSSAGQIWRQAVNTCRAWPEQPDEGTDANW